MTVRKWTDDDDARLLKLSNQCISIGDIMEKSGWTRQVVIKQRAALRRKGYDFPAFNKGKREYTKPKPSVQRKSRPTEDDLAVYGSGYF